MDIETFSMIFYSILIVFQCISKAFQGMSINLQRYFNDISMYFKVSRNISKYINDIYF
jgi:hypothetical protein